MPKTTHDELVEEIRLRGSKGAEFNSGIITADRYLRTLQECVGSDACYKFAVKSNSPSFQDQITKAANTLTYNNDEMILEEQMSLDDLPSIEDIYGVPLVLPKNCLLAFRHILTTPKKDRDGDTLRTEGARPDPKMLMLFQHTHTLPIGKTLGIAQHTKNRLSMYSAIVDMNALSHDSAVMIDNGMGRFSHGFRALDFMKVKEDETHGRTTSPGGFDIKSFEIMEASLVSVPSNTDAEVQEVLLSLVESKKLTSPLMKGVGKNIRTKRPLQINVPYKMPVAIDLQLTLNGKAIDTEDHEHDEVEESVGQDSTKSAVGTGTKCGCGCNGAPGGCGKGKPAPEKADDDATDESEQKSADNEKMKPTPVEGAAEHMCPKCGSPLVGGTCNKCGYTMKKDFDVKAGRVISSANMLKLTKACDHMKKIHESELLLTKGGRDSCKEAHSLVEEVIQSATPGDMEIGAGVGVERSVQLTVKDAMAFFIAEADEHSREKMFDVLATMKNIDTRTERTKKFQTLSSKK